MRAWLKFAHGMLTLWCGLWLIALLVGVMQLSPPLFIGSAMFLAVGVTLRVLIGLDDRFSAF